MVFYVAFLVSNLSSTISPAACELHRYARKELRRIIRDSCLFFPLKEETGLVGWLDGWQVLVVVDTYWRGVS